MTPSSAPVRAPPGYPRQKIPCLIDSADPKLPSDMHGYGYYCRRVWDPGRRHCWLCSDSMSPSLTRLTMLTIHSFTMLTTHPSSYGCSYGYNCSGGPIPLYDCDRVWDPGKVIDMSMPHPRTRWNVESCVDPSRRSIQSMFPSGIDISSTRAMLTIHPLPIHSDYEAGHLQPFSCYQEFSPTICGQMPIASIHHPLPKCPMLTIHPLTMLTIHPLPASTISTATMTLQMAALYPVPIQSLFHYSHPILSRPTVPNIQA
jgi:hypothetical protein